jgi:hypothetical protein
VCGTKDNIIATGTATILPSGTDPSGPFHGEVEYTLNDKVSGSIVVYIVSARDGGIDQLSSVPVTIYP